MSMAYCDPVMCALMARVDCFHSTAGGVLSCSLTFSLYLFSIFQGSSGAGKTTLMTRISVCVTFSMRSTAIKATGDCRGLGRPGPPLCLCCRPSHGARGSPPPIHSHRRSANAPYRNELCKHILAMYRSMMTMLLQMI
jgi:hypothetical protein